MKRIVSIVSAAVLAAAGLCVGGDEPSSSPERLPFAPPKLAPPDGGGPKTARPPFGAPFFPLDVNATADAEPAEAETATSQNAAKDDAANGADPVDAKPAEPAESAPASLDDLRKDVAALRSDVKALQQTLAALDGRLFGHKEMPEDIGDLGRLARGVDAAQQLAKDLDGRLSRVATDLRNSETIIGQNTNEIRRIRNGTAAQEDAIMDADGNLRPEVIPTRSGKLVIVNTDAAAERVLYVNGTPWKARLGRSYIWVPLGNVAVNTKGATEPQILSEWKKNAKTGVMEIEFKF